MLFYRYAYWPYGVFKKMGVPGPSPVPFFGTMLEYRRVGCSNAKGTDIIPSSKGIELATYL